jgi:cytoskeletal protein RodZ
MNETNKETNNKKLFIIVGVLAVVFIVLIAVLLINKKTPTNQTSTTQTNVDQTVGTTTNTDASAATNEVTVAPVTKEQPLKDVKIVVPGANPITSDNKVVTKTGAATDNTAPVMSDSAPKQTGFLSKEELPTTMTKLSVSAAGFSPKEFTTKAGAPTSFAITSTDDEVHVIAFSDPSLSAIAVLVGPGQTKAIVFNAPTTAGKYEFHCVSPSHAARGEVGTMIVK